MKKIIGGMMMAAALVAVVPAQASETEDAERALKDFTLFCNGRLDEFIGLLPPSYVTDIETVIHAFAKRMDAEVWEKGRDLICRVCAVMISKNALIGEAMCEMGVKGPTEKDADPVGSTMGNIVPLLDSVVAPLAKSNAMTLDSLKQTDAMALAKALTPAASKIVDARAFIVAPTDAYTGETIDVNALKMVAAKTSEDTIALTFEHRPAPKMMKRVEGKWIPEETAASWKDEIKAIHEMVESIDFASDAGKREKAQIMMVMGMFELMLKQAESAETKEEMQQSIGNLFGFFMALSNREAVINTLLQESKQ